MNQSGKEIRLIRDCLRGKREAQRALYQRHKVYLFGVAMRYGKSREEAEDILQEGFYKIFKDLKQYKSEGPLQAWMRKVVVNAALMHLRKYHKLSFSATESSAVELHQLADTSLLDSDRAKAIILLIQALPISQQIVFNMRGIEGYSFKEISEKLGTNEATLRSHYLRARKQLQTMLRKELNNEG